MARLERDARRDALRSSAVFQVMKPEELEAILRFATDRRVAKGTVIVRKGDAGSSLMAVLRGRVRVSSVSAEGKEVTITTLGAGEVFGEIALFDGEPRSADVTALEETDLLIVERREFLPFLYQNTDVCLRLLAMMSRRLRNASLALEELALHDLPERLARVLLRLAEDYGRPTREGIRIDFKVSQSDLGTRVGTSRETVNKQIKQWRDDGVLELDGRYIVLRRPDELKFLLE